MELAQGAGRDSVHRFGTWGRADSEAWMAEVLDATTAESFSSSGLVGCKRRRTRPLDVSFSRKLVSRKKVETASSVVTVDKKQFGRDGAVIA